MTIYIVITKFKTSSFDAIKSVVGVFDDRQLAEACASQFKPSGHFELETKVIEKELITNGSPEGNKIMLGG